jgi:hypothetical protein
MKENIISFSLWGNEKMYVEGALENLKLAPEIYPGWKVRIYVDDSVARSTLELLHKNGADIRLVQNPRGSFDGMYWRFLVNDDRDVDRFIIRDLDSRLNFREQAAVNEWIESGKTYHIMRDHPNHIYAIQGGMWGGKANNIKIWPLTEQWGQYNSYLCDQLFLQQIFYPKIKDDSLVHDPYIEKKPFPKHEPIYNGGTFVGQIFKDGIPQPV